MVSKKALVLPIVAVAAYPFWKTVSVPPYFNDKRSKNRAAIVVGATGNVGKATTYGLLLRKVRVIMACRDMEKCRLVRRELVLKNDSKNIVCRHLDLEDIDSINKFVDTINETEPHVDILINCAAVKNVEPKELTKYGIEKNYFVNYVAPFLLTLRLLPKLEESAAITRDSRIINVIGTPKSNWDIKLDDINFNKRKYNSKSAYRQSKVALAYFTQLLEERNKEKENCVYVYGTSPVFWHIRDPLYHPRTLLDSLMLYIKAYRAISADGAAGPILKCALEVNFADRKRSGRLYTYFLSSWGAGWPNSCRDQLKAKVVWNATTNLLLNLPDPPKEKPPAGQSNQPTVNVKTEPAKIT